MQRIVFTFVGEDRAGLVERIAGMVSSHGGNWLESQLAQMAGKFAGIVTVEIAESDAQALLDALVTLADNGLTVVAERCDGTAPHAGRSGTIALLGNDRPGIVHEIATALSALQVNVQELSSEVQSAPMAGIPLFSARVAIEIPADTDIPLLQDNLERAANSLDIDIHLELNSAP